MVKAGKDADRTVTKGARNVKALWKKAFGQTS